MDGSIGSSRSKGIFFALALALALGGCATSSHHEHEHSPAEETTASQPDEHGDDQPSPKADNKPFDNVRQSAGDAKGTEAAPSSQGDDTHAILQLTVDDTELDQYLKLAEPGRFPLKIAGSAVPPNIELVKATKPVVVTSPPTSKKDAVLVVTDIDVKGNEASVSYRYDIEGIRGTAYLKKTPHGWELTRSRIVEH
jgi:hypothetical protein